MLIILNKITKYKGLTFIKAESELSISWAIAIYSNETFEADDQRLNYESYKELSFIGGECREAIFLKKREARSPHFSHFRDIGKSCHCRKGSDSSTQDTDSENRKQSLGKFQTNSALLDTF